MFGWITDPDIWASLLTLTVLEIVLGIDNVVFIAVVSERLPRQAAGRARRIGLALALLLRIAMLLAITWIIGLTEPIAEIEGFALSWRDVILIVGGLFLLVKGTFEIHDSVEGNHAPSGAVGEAAAFAKVVAQITVIDVVFSIDSVVTAVGMAEHVEVMIAAVVIAIVIMMVAAGPVGAFIARHPTTKMLALSFLLLIGMALVADGLHFHIPRGYLYFAVAFSLAVEVLNVLARRRRDRAR